MAVPFMYPYHSLNMTKAKIKFTHPLIKYFDYDHLPQKLQLVVKPIHDLAKKLDSDLDAGPEKDEGFRKLLEAKDCFLRAAL